MHARLAIIAEEESWQRRKRDVAVTEFLFDRVVSFSVEQTKNNGALQIYRNFWSNSTILMRIYLRARTLFFHYLTLLSEFGILWSLILGEFNLKSEADYKCKKVSSSIPTCEEILHGNPLWQKFLDIKVRITIRIEISSKSLY